MTRKDFKEFYSYITAFAIGEVNLVEKEKCWKAIKNTSLEMATQRARGVYKYLEHSPSLINPRVFSGELPNPGLYGKVDCKLPC